MAKGFERFIGNEKGSVKKEKIRQEKKKARVEKQEFFKKKKEEARNSRPPRQEFKKEDRANTADSGNRKETYSPGKTGKFPGKTGKSTLRDSDTRGNNKPPREAVPIKAKTKSSAYQDKDNKSPDSPNPETKLSSVSEQMPLNKFVSHAGICSRRDAADLVKSGKITVNNKPVTEPGYKVQRDDEVRYNGKKISARKNLVYILLNKPKDFITTTSDPEGRKTVQDIIKNATTERVYPIGRLDRNTTGVLLFTNDGDLAQKLSHPSYQIKKIYEVKLDKSMARKDMESMMEGLHLEDGFIAADAVAYADSRDKSVVGVEIHSGRNRIVRRMFEHLGYDVRNLDRVMFANLTKKNVERGKWRFLSEKEVRLLKFMNASYSKKK